MDYKDLQSEWLKTNKVKKIDSINDDYKSKDNLKRSKKTYDELHQDKKVIVTNNQGNISTTKPKELDFEALQTLKSYDLKDDKEEDYYIGKFIRIRNDSIFSYYEIFRKESFIVGKRVKEFYICSNGLKFLERELRLKKIFTYEQVDTSKIY